MNLVRKSCSIRFQTINQTQIRNVWELIVKLSRTRIDKWYQQWNLNSYEFLALPVTSSVEKVTLLPCNLHVFSLCGREISRSTTFPPTVYKRPGLGSLFALNRSYVRKFVSMVVCLDVWPGGVLENWPRRTPPSPDDCWD